MSKLSRDKKLEVSREIAIALAPYLWERKWGFGLNMYFDDVHVDYREMHSYLYDEKSANDREKILALFEDRCIEYGTAQGENYEAFKEFIALYEDAEMYIACEQEIFEEIYLYVWEGTPTASGIVDALDSVLKSYGLAFQVHGSAIVIISEK
ncbi:MAG: hypothetical protein K5639_01830 [Eubacterium sp.]|nr:hypothetical protein [Eubacterium sp.]